MMYQKRVVWTVGASNCIVQVLWVWVWVKACKCDPCPIPLHSCQYQELMHAHILTALLELKILLRRKGGCAPLACIILNMRTKPSRIPGKVHLAARGQLIDI